MPCRLHILNTYIYIQTCLIASGSDPFWCYKYTLNLQQSIITEMLADFLVFPGAIFQSNCTMRCKYVDVSEWDDMISSLLFISVHSFFCFVISLPSLLTSFFVVEKVVKFVLWIFLIIVYFDNKIYFNFRAFLF